MITLTLGDFTFARGELPESIEFGASQKLHVHTLVGGARVVDAMGAVPLRPEWSGWFIGTNALARARYLKQLAEAGQPLALRFGAFAYTVVIAAFSAEFRAGPNLPYTITLEVVSDLGTAGSGASLPGLAQMVGQDLASAAANAAAIGDKGLIAAVGIVSSAVTVNDAADPAPATIGPLLPTIAAAQAQAAQLNVAASATIAALGQLSAPNTNGASPRPDQLGQFSAGLAAAVTAASQSGLLNATVQALGRMTTNLEIAGGTAGAGGATLTTGSTDLYHLAAAAYGDARAWTWIAQANQRTDPVVVGITQLVIPPADATAATGVLSA